MRIIDIILLAALAAVICLAVRTSLKRKKRGTCCGGGCTCTCENCSANDKICGDR